MGQSFSALTGSVKTEMGDNFDLGLFYTSQGNGVGLDYGVTGLEGNITIKADLEIPTLAAIGKYQINDAMSVFVGAKQTTVKAGDTHISSVWIQTVTAFPRCNISLGGYYEKSGIGCNLWCSL